MKKSKSDIAVEILQSKPHEELVLLGDGLMAMISMMQMLGKEAGFDLLQSARISFEINGVNEQKQPAHDSVVKFWKEIAEAYEAQKISQRSNRLSGDN